MLSSSAQDQNALESSIKPVLVKCDPSKTRREYEFMFERITLLYEQKEKFKKGEYFEDPDILEVLSEAKYP